MNDIFAKTFGGLTRAYLFRQLFFGAAMGVLAIAVLNKGSGGTGASIWAYLWVAVNIALYPYSRFVYESVVSFILGENVFYLNAIFMLVAKLFTMYLCFMFAPVIAPLGLAYLYFRHSKVAA